MSESTRWHNREPGSSKIRPTPRPSDFIKAVTLIGEKSAEFIEAQRNNSSRSKRPDIWLLSSPCHHRFFACIRVGSIYGVGNRRALSSLSARWGGGFPRRSCVLREVTSRSKGFCRREHLATNSCHLPHLHLWEPHDLSRRI